ncbi:MAG TPA: NUDIX hydrolase, partial [Xanthomonadaceae bacterium]|nr:NUDIX hydrolase [Xanthomonadaceae bacterium]
MSLPIDEPPEVLHAGKWLRLMRRGRWEYAERSTGDGMAVIVVAATPDDHVLFVEQPRVPIGARTIEMPAGLVGDDHAHDTLEAAALRELEEETGWRAGRVDVLL